MKPTIQPSSVALKAHARRLMIGFPIMAVFWYFVLGLFGEKWLGTFFLSLGLGGFITGLLSALFDSVGKVTHRIWSRLQRMTEFILSFVAMSLVFYLVMTPIGIILSMLGKLSFEKAPRQKTQSYWKEAPEPAKSESYFRQF